MKRPALAATMVTVLAGIGALGVGAYNGMQLESTAQSPGTEMLTPNSPVDTNTVSARFYQNAALTPGALVPGITADIVCRRGYANGTGASTGARNVPDAEKAEVYKEYGIISRTPGEYEVDHLISLELGGSNDIRNLWPEAYHVNMNGYEVGAHTKDAIEDRLHSLVCEGKLSLAQAQQEISTDWISSYKARIGPLPAYKD